MWVVLRNQNSYTIGQYTDRVFTRPDNQQKLWVGLNSITENFWYNDDENKTMRLVVSAPTKNVLVWSVTKIENVQPLGIQKLTLYQTQWNEHTDGWTNDEYGNYVPYANINNSNIEPTDPTTPSTPSPTPSSIYGKITASTSTIKVGGSYKTLTLKLYDSDDNEVTDNYSSSDFKWTCSVTDGDETTDLSDTVTWREGSESNQIKIKFPDDRSYLDKMLEIKCVISGDETITTTTALFELVSA